jgi:hypothetical protein
MTSLCGLKLVVNANSKDAPSNYTRSPVSILTTDISKKVTFTRNVFHTTKSNLLTCLPNLTRVAATLPWLPYLIAGRRVSEVVTTRCVPQERSNSLISFTLGNPDTHDRLFLPTSNLGHPLASVFLPLTHFTMTTIRLGTFSKSQEVC